MQMNDVPLARLTHDIVQNTYKDLHALLDSLGDASPSERKKRLVDFVLKARHRFARLLVSVRWFMSYSAFHGSAQMTRQMASSRSDVYTYDADGLYNVSQAAKAASSLPSALAEAAEILGPSGILRRLPRVIESSIGLDIHSDTLKRKKALPAPTAEATQSGTSVGNKAGIITSGESDYSSGVDSDGDSSADGGDGDVATEAIRRLRATVLRVVVDNLPQGTRVLGSGAVGNDVAVRIGVPGAWNVDVVLDGLKEEAKALRVLTQEINIDGHPDAPTGMHHRRKARDAKERVLPLRQEHSVPLRASINDRLYLTAMSLPDELSESDRMKRVLRILALVMSLECCAGVAMAHIRSQAGALLMARGWKESGLTVTGRWQEERRKNPKCTLNYWRRSHSRASVSFSAARVQDEQVLNHDEDAKAITRIIDIKHEPPLPGRGLGVQLKLGSLNVEEAVLYYARLRAQNDLAPIADRCNDKFKKDGVLANVVSGGKTCESILVKFGYNDGAVMFNLSLTSGGYFVTPRGFIASELETNRDATNPLRQAIWKGEKFFSRSEAIWDSFEPIVKDCSRMARLEAVARGVLGGGGDVISTWPPGVTYVENSGPVKDNSMIVPPFTIAERNSPRGFVSLVGLAGVNDTRKRPRAETRAPPGISTPSVNARKVTGDSPSASISVKRKSDATTSSDVMASPKRRRRERGRYQGLEHKSADGLVFFEGRLPKTLSSSLVDSESKAMTANRMIGLHEARHDVGCRLRHENLLDTLMRNGIILSWDATGVDCEKTGPHEVAVTPRISPIEVDKAVVQFREGNEWRLRLKLRRDIFDDTGFANWGASYRKQGHLLQLCYTSSSKQCIRSCARDVVRVRTAAMLSMSLREGEKRYKVLERQLSHVLVEGSGKKLMIGFGGSSVEVEVHPKSEFFRVEIIPYMEEMLLESRKEMGRLLVMMMKTTVPMAVAMEAAIKNLSHTKWRFRLISVFRARLIVVTRSAKGGSVACGVDIEGHKGNGRVIVCDVERVRKAREVENSGKRNDEGGPSSNSTADTGCIPTWNIIVERLVGKKWAIPISNGMGMEIDVGLLYPVLKNVFQPGVPKALPTVNKGNE